MKKILALTTVTLLMMGLSAMAADTTTGRTKETHSANSMASGHHMMPPNKQDQMANKAMPSMNPKCSDAALAKMPADHRAACQKKD